MTSLVVAVVLGASILLVPSAASAAEWSPGEEKYDITVTTDIPVTMPDGRVLRAAIHAPAIKGTKTPAPGDFPVILIQTPYSKTVGNVGVGAVPPYLVKRGYIGAIVDVAGTGGSEGQSQLFGKQEGKDGAELVRWAADLPGSNGRVGLLGGSYLGIDQLFTAAEVGKDSPLKAIFPIVSSSDPYRDLFSVGGIVNVISPAGLLAAYFGLRTLTPLADRGPTDPVDALRLMLEHGLAGIPFELQTGLDVLLQGDRVYDSAYWQERAPQRVLDKIVANDVPAYLVGEQYDVFQRGEPLLYSGLQNASVGRSVWQPMEKTQKADPRWQLKTGPYDHSSAGEGLDKIQLQWFDQWLKGRDTGILDTTRPFHVEETGGRKYDLAAYPSEHSTPERWFFQPGQKLSPATPTARTGSSTAVWKGFSLSCARSLGQWSAGILSPAYEACSKVPAFSVPQPGDVAYDSGTLPQDLRLAGPVGLTLNATSTSSETMFAVTLQDVAPDGKISDLTAGGLLGSARAIDPDKSWPDGHGGYQLPYHPQTRVTAEKVRPGKVTQFDVEIRPAFSTIPKGHSLRVLIGSGDTLHLLPPPTKLLDLLLGVYRIQHNSTTPSWITLPVAD
ncbi:CocE/NonD family hydrolase [Aeromicrobium sp.]|uniref:CocE/NonD family hydrolase n=1 Tax=Aeromicrobium sp. TaxID=1871063 RepID=UPI0030BCFDDE